MSKDVRRRGAGQYRCAGARVSQGGGSRDRSGSNSSGSSHGGGRSKNTSINALKASFQRSNSHDKVRKIVAEEGRAARNLIAWSVPLETKEEEAKSKNNSKNQRAGPQRSRKNAGVDNKSTSALDKGMEKSPSKSRQPRKVDLRARYWAFLFDNLRRAVDEIYVTCESDQSVVECREVLMMLDNYVRDFKALIDWIQLQEKLENTDAQNRPTSLAWEVRKMSPGRHVMGSPSADRVVPSPGVRRALNFGGPPPSLAAARLSHTGPSWADRVKYSHSSHGSHTTVLQVEKPGKKDAEGWETVQRGRPAKPRSAAMIAKVSPVVAQTPPKADQTRAKAPPPQEPVVTQCQSQDLKPAEEDLKKEVHKSGDALESPAEGVQDTGQAFCTFPLEEAPLPTPIQAPEPTPTPPSAISAPVDRLLTLGGSGTVWATSAPGQAKTPDKRWWGWVSVWGGGGVGCGWGLGGGGGWGCFDGSVGEKDVRKWKEELLEQRRKMMEEKLLHAELKREVQLQAIVKKAQEEEAKVNEIAFINTLEAQNKRHDALAKLNEYEQRLNELQEERQRRQEEKTGPRRGRAGDPIQTPSRPHRDPIQTPSRPHPDPIVTPS
uniref:S phase cyclin A-associated protein in the endoplasmic reticulum N-terminal domain-containing protein n=1 Tax=Knipowitschia caucasica TaxID=637954 RepID=A0AAV2L700_KNICA